MECNLTLHLRRFYLRFETLECPLFEGWVKCNLKLHMCNLTLQEV